MTENGTTPYTQNVDSRQSGRLHDDGHDPRETDQVRKCSELARQLSRNAANLHSNTICNNSHSLDEHSQQLSELQTHSKLGNKERDKVDDANEELITVLGSKQ